MNGTPPVKLLSVFFPMWNEEDYVERAIRAAEEECQRLVGLGEIADYELVIVDDCSTDRTPAIADGLAAADPRIRVVDNPAGRTPHALNLGVAAARHSVVVRVDGHGELTDGYIARAVELLEETGAANVGGVMDAQGRSPFEQAVASAYTTRLGLGGSRFHLAGSPAGETETVFLGVFRKEALEAVGGFDESMHRAQDWELNYRLRADGRRVWFSPELRVTYRPRSSLRALVRQMYETGKWRREVVRRHPETASVRYLAPPVVAATIAAGTLAGVLGLLTGVDGLKAGWAAPLGYAGGVLAASALEGRGLSWRARAWLPVVLGTVHLSWGTGFLFGSRPPQGPGARGGR